MNTTVKATIGAALLAVCAEASYADTYAQRRLGETRLLLEKIYGQGLVGLYNSQGKVTRERLSWSQMIPKVNWLTLGSLDFLLDAESSKAWWLGFVEGNEYKGMEKTSFNHKAETNCMYAVWGAMQTYDQWVWNAHTMTTTPGAIYWWDVIVYDPWHMLGDSLVVYEYCNIQEYFNQLTSLASLDWSFWVQTITRGVTFMMRNFNHYMERISLLDGSRCVVAPKEEDLEVNWKGAVPGFFGTDVIVDPTVENYPETTDINYPGERLGVTYIEDSYHDKNHDLLIDCVPNQFEIGRVWGEVLAHLTGSWLDLPLIID